MNEHLQKRIITPGPKKILALDAGGIPKIISI